MSAATFTPGPWTMETVRTSCGVVFKVGPFPWKHGKLNHACIYADYPSAAEHAVGVANARLIAMAPELLTLLREAVAKDCLTGAMLSDALAAIAKATGVTR